MLHKCIDMKVKIEITQRWCHNPYFLCASFHNFYSAEAALQMCFRNRCSENMQQIYRKVPMPKHDFNKVSKQLYRNHIRGCILSCKFAAYFQRTFLWEHLWRDAHYSVKNFAQGFQNVCGAGVFKQSFRFINIWWNKIQ